MPSTQPKPVRPAAKWVAHLGLPLVVLWLCLIATAVLRSRLETSALAQAARMARDDYAATLDREASKFGSRFDELSDELRMIAMSPDVMKIDRHAEDFGADDRAMIQAYYHNLANDTGISEFYIVPADLDPDALDPVTGKNQIPITTFDDDIAGKNANTPTADDDDHQRAKIPEVEIFEYRAMKDQCRYYLTHFPDRSSLHGQIYPGISSRPLITCDNTEFTSADLARHDDSPRMGIVYSEPIYGSDGKFRGMISAVLRFAPVQHWIDEKYLSVASGNQLSLSVGTPTPPSPNGDNSIIYRKQTDIDVNDQVPWNIGIAVPAWAFYANEDFDIAQARLAPIWGGGIGMAVLMSGLVWSLATSRRRALALAQAMTTSFASATSAAEVAKRHFRLLLDSSAEGIYGIDTEGKCTFVNRTAARLLGYQPDELLGRDIHWQIHFKRADNTPYRIEECPVYQSIKFGGCCHVRDEVFWKKNGEALSVEYFAVPIFDGEKVIGSVTSFSDVSARLQAEAELCKAKEAAEAASRAKGEFLARMSHEIRTPLNGVVGLIDLLNATELDQTQQQYAELARQSADSLITVINDILDFSKIEAGKIDFESIEFDIHHVVENLCRLLAPVAARKGLALGCLIKPDVPRRLIGDPNRVRQVLTNLIGNAIKFTPAGSVRTRVSLERSDESHCVVAIEVQDTGIGIPADRLDRLFKSFSQVDTSTTRRFGGTGLGLAISKRLVELMGGEIGVESEIGRGATFRFSLSLPIPAESPQGEHDPVERLRHICVLAAEGDDSHRAIRREQFEGRFSDGSLVVDSREALSVLRERAEGGKPFDAAVLAYRADDTGLLSAIQCDPALRHTKFIAVLDTEDHTRFETLREAGFHAHLQRPLTPSSLMDAIAAVVVPSAAPNPAVHAKPAAAAKSRGLHFLVAEDHDMNQFLTREILKRNGCTCEIVADGSQAVSALESGRYDMVLMDCQMPVMDGLEATRQIRRREAGSIDGGHIPIIALTAEAISGDREKCLAAGMDGYVSKPIDQRELFAVIDSLTTKTEAEVTAA